MTVHMILLIKAHKPMKTTRKISVLLLALLVSGAVFAQKSVGQHVDDSSTTVRVKMALLDESVSDAADINVETSKGIVHLAGFVDSEETKAAAGELARGVDGVKSVSNRLRVMTEKRSAGRALDDTVLAAKIKLKLVESKKTSGGKINVEVRAASVELSGFVNSYEERDAAVMLVSEINGVKDVFNSIDITR